LASKSSSNLSNIPGVDTVKQAPAIVELLGDLSETFVTGIVREVIDEIRAAQRDAQGDATPAVDSDVNSVATEVVRRVRLRLKPTLARVINGTGIIVHTNLGRSVMGPAAIAAITEVAAGYCDLEMDISEGRRGRRDSLIEPLLCALTGAEAATVVNNNAAAVMIALDTLARDGEVVVSRGELVEIGGSFRIPDVMEKSGAGLVEVGTTNRTHLADYERAISPETSAFLKVHKSNYDIIGFTCEVTLAELVELGGKHGIPVVEDLGSGAFVDVSKFGLKAEPTPASSIKAGADVVTFSGDKLLGGPQAGILVGKREHIEAIRKNPLMRTFRVDKFTLSALGAVLQAMHSSREPEKEIPTLEMMSRSIERIESMIEQVTEAMGEAACSALRAKVVDGESQAGGGSCPGQSLPTRLLSLTPPHISPDELSRMMRLGTPAIMGIIRDDSFCLDFRTVLEDELPHIATALALAATQSTP
jgi:L-seryl-tRNA(Ser) seleniumtransferase